MASNHHLPPRSVMRRAPDARARRSAFAARLWTSFAMVAILVTGLAAAGWWWIDRLGAQFIEVLDQRVPRVVLLQDLLNDLGRLELSARDALILTDPADVARALQQIETGRTGVGVKIQALQSAFDDGSETGRAAARQFGSQSAGVLVALIKFSRLVEAGDRSAATAMLGGALRMRLETLSGAINDFRAVQTTLLQSAKDATQQQVAQAHYFMLALLGATLLAGGACSVGIAGSITRPLATALSALRTEARTDRLTGLPNRAFLVERLEQAVASARRDPALGFALLFIDFDRFKLVNDTLGHDAGDQLLKCIAQRLRGVLQPGLPFAAHRGGRDDLLGAVIAGMAIGGVPGERGDAGDGDHGDHGDHGERCERANIVARFGGDEFVVLLAGTAGAAGADAAAGVARRLLDTFAAPYQIENHEIHSTASIGIALSGAIDGSAGSLLRNADLAMYEAKRAGRATFALFDQQMQVRVARAVHIEEALHRALALEQLSLVYQPIVDLKTGRTNSVEALLRWQHPELGSVSPAEFIPIAEESGLIVQIGEWVLREACMQWRRWQQQAPARAPATMSVNLSRVQMAAGDQLLALVARVQHDAGMSPGCLQLEVTEREVMRDPAAIITLMTGLRAMGVKLAMDDFGTGTSSLACLRDHPFDVIKIDKSFVDDRSGSAAMLAVIHATVALIEKLGMVSVAEGIEDRTQVEILQSLGCRYAQGYYFARPLPAERLLDQMTPGRDGYCPGILPTEVSIAA